MSIFTRRPRFIVGGRVALVTGAAHGIGLATARAVVERGGRVVMVDIDGAAVRAAAAALHPTRAVGLQADVTDQDAMRDVVSVAIERFGQLDLVVANAGISPRPSTFRAMPPEEFDRVIAVNQAGVVNTVRAALTPIIQRAGHVVVISSIYAFANGAGETPYAMSKAAVEQFGLALRVELAPHGASSTVAYFGFVDTALVRDAFQAGPDSLPGAIPRLLRKQLTADQAARALMQAIEGRKARVVAPVRWVVPLQGRGFAAPIAEAVLLRDPRQKRLVRELDRLQPAVRPAPLEAGSETPPAPVP